MKQLVGIGLAGLNITGSLPSEVLALPNLNILELSNNAFTGEIPSDIWDESAIEEMNLNNNQLSGSLPSQLCSVPSPGKAETVGTTTL